MEHYQSKNHFYDILESVIIDIGNYKSIVLVSSEIENNNSYKSFILNVLKAAKLNIDENCQFSVLLPDVQYRFISDKSASTIKILCFGIEGKQLGLQIESSKNTFFRLDNLEMVFGENPEKYKSENLKRALWEAVKKLFNI